MRSFVIALAACFGGRVLANNVPPVATTQCGGNTYVYKELAGFGTVSSDAVDSTGDTLGGWGSSAAIDRASWKKLCNGSYVGTLYGLPDRGWYELLLVPFLWLGIGI